MKKEYIAPEIRMKDIELSNMLCESANGPEVSPSGETDVMQSKIEIWHFLDEND